MTATPSTVSHGFELLRERNLAEINSTARYYRHVKTGAELLSLVGRLGCNVIDVEHSRISGALSIGQVNVALSMETRGPRHRIDVLDALRASGLQVEIG